MKQENIQCLCFHGQYSFYNKNKEKEIVKKTYLGRYFYGKEYFPYLIINKYNLGCLKIKVQWFFN